MKKVFLSILVCLTAILLNSACTHAVLWNKYYKDGMQEFEAKNYGDAENLLGLAVRQANHRSMPAQERILSLRALGITQMLLKKYPEALLNFQNASELIFKQSGRTSKEFAENLEDIGINLAKQKKYEDACLKLSEGLDICDQLKLKDSQNLRLLQSLAYCQQKCGKQELAAKAYARYFASHELSQLTAVNDLNLLKDYRKILSALKKKVELAKTDVYLKKLSAKA